jgi:hypothetical protein
VLSVFVAYQFIIDPELGTAEIVAVPYPHLVAEVVLTTEGDVHWVLKVSAIDQVLLLFVEQLPLTQT